MDLNHAGHHVIAPGEGIDMDSPSEYTCLTCGAIVSTEAQATHLQHHEYVIGLQNRLTQLERSVQQYQNDLATLMRQRGGGSMGGKIYPDTYGRYSRDEHDAIWGEEWPVDPPFDSKKTVKRTGLTPKGRKKSA